jgi:uroporphyrinogen decarboxylase
MELLARSSVEEACKVSSQGCTENDWNRIFPLKNDLILRAARGEFVERTPVWVFRQAGRSLPEYAQYKISRKKNFLELLQDPEDMAECTLQPIRRYPVDAAILFSDILVLLQAMDVEVTMPDGQGITVPHPLISPHDFASRFDTKKFLRERLSHIFRAIGIIKEELQGNVPLIGFSAAPWTLFYYLVGGHSKKNQTIAREWLEKYPIESKKILDSLTELIVEYLVLQAQHGADLVQVFEAMGEFLVPDEFARWAVPCLQQLAQSFRDRCPDIPIMIFPRGACHSIVALQSAGYDVVSIDSQTSPQQAREQLRSAVHRESDQRRIRKEACLQGNFPVNLLQRTPSLSLEESRQRVVESVRSMLTQFGPQRLIANLGEGLSGIEDPDLVLCFVNSVHDISKQMIADKCDQ